MDNVHDDDDDSDQSTESSASDPEPQEQEPTQGTDTTNRAQLKDEGQMAPATGNPPATSYEKFQRQRRLARNRRTAKIRRARKKKHVAELEEAVDFLKAANERLVRENAIVREENRRLVLQLSILRSPQAVGNHQQVNFQYSDLQQNGQTTAAVLPVALGSASLPFSFNSISNNHQWPISASHPPLGFQGQSGLVLDSSLLSGPVPGGLQLPVALFQTGGVLPISQGVQSSIVPNHTSGILHSAASIMNGATLIPNNHILSSPPAAGARAHSENHPNAWFTSPRLSIAPGDQQEETPQDEV